MIRLALVLVVVAGAVTIRAVVRASAGASSATPPRWFDPRDLGAQ